MEIKNLTVFCGSKTGNDPVYMNDAMRLGEILAEKNIALIYGGGNKGLMGAIANAVLDNGGTAIGIMPHILSVPEHAHTGLTEMYEVEDMHSRKKMLYEKGDAALILPGGYGTMDEFFEALTWNQLNIHDKKMFIMNTNGFYEDLISLIRKMEMENFLYHSVSDKIIILSSPEELKSILNHNES